MKHNVSKRELYEFALLYHMSNTKGLSEYHHHRLNLLTYKIAIYCSVKRIISADDPANICKGKLKCAHVFTENVCGWRYCKRCGRNETQIPRCSPNGKWIHAFDDYREVITKMS